jgi:glutamate-ammonia-ligase adenylyltransferase
MREKLRQARPPQAGLFDVKHGHGGMVDAEFAVQFLVLGHGQAHPGLRANVGNIALLQRAEAVGLLPTGVGQTAARAYRSLRRLQHRARLDEAPTQVPPETVATESLAIARLWECTLGTQPTDSP